MEEEEKGVSDKKRTRNEVVLQISDNEATEPQINRNQKGQSKSKPKSRMVDPPCPKDANFIEEKTQISRGSSPNKKIAVSHAAYNPPRDFDVSDSTVGVTSRTPLIRTSKREEEDDDDGSDDDEEEEVYKTADIAVKRSGKKRKSMKWIELLAFICIMGFLIATLTIHTLQDKQIRSLELWKWCVLTLVVLSGRLVTEWFMNVMVFLIERNFLFKKKVLYFVYGLRKSVEAFIWLSLVLLTWSLLFDHGVKRTRRVAKILDYITRTIASCVIAAAMWLAKTFFIKLLSSYFQSTRFFDRVQESIFHQYILRTLSGPPLMETVETLDKNSSNSKLSFKTLASDHEKKGKKQRVIDVEKLKKIKTEKVSAWTTKGLINVITSSGLSTNSYTPEGVDVDESDQKDDEITSEFEAKAAAYRIFKNVAKPESKHIEKEDLLRFMKTEEVENVLPLFEGAAETGRIKRKSLKNWLGKVYLGRRSLVHSLNDANTAVDDLNMLCSAIVLVVAIIVWLLLMGFLTTKFLVFISSQLLLVGFMFGNTAKTVFEAIIFVFVMHPFDVGDRCVIDGVQMVVEEMNILNTVFLSSDNEKICYPNSVLSNKPISNFYRSPEMRDSVEFDVDVSTSRESIGALKARLKEYLESKPQHWYPSHSVLVKDIENINKMKMGLYVTHTINFQNYSDKNSRRSELVLELKKILEDLNIKYHLLPQEVHLNHAKLEDSKGQKKGSFII